MRKAWSEASLDALMGRLEEVRAALLKHEEELAPRIQAARPAHRASARNLAHYLALRRLDLRPLQRELARLGLSSLGRAESNVLASLDKVLGILHRLAGKPWRERSDDEPVGMRDSRRLLERNTVALLGRAPRGRAVRIMVTLPSEAALDASMVRRLVDGGMDVARINCAHDGPAQWRAMAGHVRRAARRAGRPVQVLMDLGGPKLRTGAIPVGPQVLKLKPRRDELGRVMEPARLRLKPAGAPYDSDLPAVGVDPSWLLTLEAGNRLRFTDARGSRRVMHVISADETGAIVHCERTAYLVPQTRLRLRGGGGSELSDIAARDGFITLSRGDRLHLVAPTDSPAQGVAAGVAAATITCTLPQVFAQVKRGERIWFDDGRIGGVVRRADSEGLEVEITHARTGGQKLAADKGINLPESRLRLPALTAADLDDLAVVVREADLVGLSFVQGAADLTALREHLLRLKRPDMGIVLKIETRAAFANLPELLFAAMQGEAAGVMIARGDLAVECGYERLAEVQEALLWATEAAHMPVIWATQVLETMARTGQPSRAEVTDAAMGERAECVMLNKGPYIDDAVRALDDILKRMQVHLSKKAHMLPAMDAWKA